MHTVISVLSVGPIHGFDLHQDEGIDSLAELGQEKPARRPFSGCLFVFRSRRATSISTPAYDGQGFWLAQKMLENREATLQSLSGLLDHARSEKTEAY